MIYRYLAGAAVSIAITGTLILFMHYLIEISAAAPTDSKPRLGLPLGRTILDTPPAVDTAPPEPPTPPVELPPLAPPTGTGDNFTFSSIHVRGDIPLMQKRASAYLGSGNSALINIISAEPDYPLRARRINQQGFVVVRFDVSESGSVENVSVMESSSTMFERAAINAALKSLYQPPTIDGVPKRVRGVRKRFLFRMDP